MGRGRLPGGLMVARRPLQRRPHVQVTEDLAALPAVSPVFEVTEGDEGGPEGAAVHPLHHCPGLLLDDFPGGAEGQHKLVAEGHVPGHSHHLDRWLRRRHPQEHCRLLPHHNHNHLQRPLHGHAHRHHGQRLHPGVEGPRPHTPRHPDQRPPRSVGLHRQGHPAYLQDIRSREEGGGLRGGVQQYDPGVASGPHTGPHGRALRHAGQGRRRELKREGVPQGALPPRVLRSLRFEGVRAEDGNCYPQQVALALDVLRSVDAPEKKKL
mmetsp:Transcript_115228/g.367644  ORF Transcript_115228/g.367644 Transcript_115228/m.367644 type:complete len:266 (+) Transcript_115228:1097-1894(+)